MQQNTSLSMDRFFIFEVEDAISRTRIELIEYSELQGQQDGLKENAVNQLSVKIKVFDYVHVKVQELIEFIKQKTLIASQVIDITTIESESKTTCTKAQLHIDNLQHQIKTLERDTKSLLINAFKIKFEPWLLPIAIFVGLADGALAYSGFRGASYSFMAALISSLAITLVIAVSHTVYTGWILRSTKWKLRLKVLLVLITGFIFFFWISTIRAAGINNEINITIPSNDTAITTPHVSQWSICGISFILFAIILFFSLVVWLSKDERTAIKNLKKNIQEIKLKKTEIVILEKEIEDIKIEIQTKKRNVRMAYDYINRSIQIAKNLGISAIREYKKAYAFFHADVPDFFGNTEELEYDETLHFSNLEKHEQ